MSIKNLKRDFSNDARVKKSGVALNVAEQLISGLKSRNFGSGCVCRQEMCYWTYPRHW